MILLAYIDREEEIATMWGRNCQWCEGETANDGEEEIANDGEEEFSNDDEEESVHSY